MNFDLNDEQREIKGTAKEFLADRFKPEKVRELAEARSYDDGLWKQIAELGWPGIAISEDDGGQGLGMVELAVLLEQSGYACAPSPLLGSAGAALVISAAGSDEQRAEWLPKLASGEATGAFGGFGPDGEQHPLLRPADRRRRRRLRRRGRAAGAGRRARLRAGRGDRRHPLLRDRRRGRGRAARRATSTPAATGSRWRSPPS